MPWIQQLPNGNWRACWRDAAGKQRSTTKHPKSGNPLRTRKIANDVAESQEEKAQTGIATDGRAPTWGQWCDVWLESRTVEPSTMRQDNVRVERYLKPRWGNVRLNTIRRSQVQAWVTELAQTPAAGRKGALLSPSTVQRIYHLFSASMKAASLDEAIPLDVSPCRSVKLAPAAPGHERFLTRTEADHVAYFLREPYQSMWLLLCGTGLRFGELAGLHWQRVDTVNATIDVVETWDPAGKRIKAYPKGKKRRTVPIPAWLLPVLADQYDRQGDKPPTTCGLTHGAGARCRSGLVITAPEGGPLDGHNIGQRDFATAVQLAGLDGVRLHDARHAYASWLVQGGVRLEEVQRLLGHASITTTQRYAHLGTSQHAAILAALD